MALSHRKSPAAGCNKQPTGLVLLWGPAASSHLGQDTPCHWARRQGAKVKKGWPLPQGVLDQVGKTGQKISGYLPSSQGSPNLGYFPTRRLSTSPQFVEAEGRGREGNPHLLSAYHVPALSFYYRTVTLMLPSDSWGNREMWTALHSRRRAPGFSVR